MSRMASSCPGAMGAGPIVRPPFGGSEAVGHGADLAAPVDVDDGDPDVELRVRTERLPEGVGPGGEDLAGFAGEATAGGLDGGGVDRDLRGVCLRHRWNITPH